jgi:hypothetical protein
MRDLDSAPTAPAGMPGVRHVPGRRGPTEDLAHLAGAAVRAMSRGANAVRARTDAAIGRGVRIGAATDPPVSDPILMRRSEERVRRRVRAPPARARPVRGRPGPAPAAALRVQGSSLDPTTAVRRPADAGRTNARTSGHARTSGRTAVRRDGPPSRRLPHWDPTRSSSPDVDRWRRHSSRIVPRSGSSSCRSGGRHSRSSCSMPRTCGSRSSRSRADR